MTYRLSIMVVLILASPMAHATGGAPAQGTLFAGQGLDWQRTATETQVFSHLSGTPFPLPVQTYHVNAAIVTLITACTSLSSQVGRCQASVLLDAPKHQPSKFCGQWLDPKNPIRMTLYALSGAVDNQGLFRSQAGHVTFACGLTTQRRHPDEDEWSALGALGKCMDWPNENGGYGYPPTGLPGGSNALFESCIRMVRGDYCGDGVSHTKDGTMIDPYLTSSLPKHIVLPAFILEANWNPAGAICIVHARYVSLPPACQDKFVQSLDVLAKPQRSDAGVTGMRGSDYWCRKLSFKIEENCTQGDRNTCPWFKDVKTALTEGFLMNDSLLQP
jgi:hypothetical protein